MEVKSRQIGPIGPRNAARTSRVWRASQAARQREPELAAASQLPHPGPCPTVVRDKQGAPFLFIRADRRQNMIRSTYLSTLAIAALLGAAPAFAQTSSSSSATGSADAKSAT